MPPPSVQLARVARPEPEAQSDTPQLRLVPQPKPDPPPAAGPVFQHPPYIRRRRLEDILLDSGAIGPVDLAKAVITQRRLKCRLGDVLLADGVISPAQLAAAIGQQYGLSTAGPAPVDCATSDALARIIAPDICLQYKAIPWRRVGGVTLVALADPAVLPDLQDKLPPLLGPYRFATVPERLLHDRISAVHGAALARAAECRVPVSLSCRALHYRRGAALMALPLILLLAALVTVPGPAIRIMTALAFASALLNVTLRLAAYLAHRRNGTPHFASRRPRIRAEHAPPRISILVPLHNEPDIAGPLTARLSRLDYPRAQLEVALVVEAGDHATRTALGNADLPPWMRVITVPDGQPRTKPRAMNYALRFVSGDIVGVYDAEDAPAPDQLRRIATRFAAAPARVACLQGCLDYYNPTLNWMSRCFTIEYAGWFRQMLPGIARLGLVVPLGGTTLFFRRAALEKVGAWDAHNVTEDADLGIRLARLGYRTEILPTTTLEEANAAPLAWVKQRSRWMKGYLLTWAVHSKNPVTLWRDLGPKRFFSFHQQFLGTILNAALAPVLWALVILALGLPHAITGWASQTAVIGIAIGISLISLLNYALMAAACDAPHHRRLRRWVPTMIAYAPLASFAVIKALVEVIACPFHWDKTTHGQHGGTGAKAEIDLLEQALSRGCAPVGTGLAALSSALTRTGEKRDQASAPTGPKYSVATPLQRGHPTAAPQPNPAAPLKARAR